MAIRNYGVDWENNRGVHYAIGLYAIEKIRKKGFIKWQDVIIWTTRAIACLAMPMITTIVNYAEKDSV